MGRQAGQLIGGAARICELCGRARFCLLSATESRQSAAAAAVAARQRREIQPLERVVRAERVGNVATVCGNVRGIRSALRETRGEAERRRRAEQGWRTLLHTLEARRRSALAKRANLQMQTPHEPSVRARPPPLARPVLLQRARAYGAAERVAELTWKSGVVSDRQRCLSSRCGQVGPGAVDVAHLRWRRPCPGPMGSQCSCE